MSNRTTTTLGAVAEIITGPFGSMLHQSDYTPTGTPVIMPQDIGNRTLDKRAIAHVGTSDAERLSRYKVQENDIVYARRGDVEKHAFIGKDDIGALCGTGCMRVRVDAQKAIPMYISFYLNRPESKRWISQHAVGSNMPNLNTEILNEVPLELPSIDEQLKTISILNSIDSKIQNNICICTELEAMAKTLFDYWFTQFDFPDADGKPYRSSGGAMEWNEQLKRKIPKGWDVGSLGSMGTITSGGTPSTKSSAYYSSKGIAWITPNDLSGKEHKLFFSHGERDITREGLNNSSAVLMPKGTVLFSSRAPIGYIAIAENEICSNQGFKSVVPDKGYGSFFVYYTVKVHTPAIAKQGVGTTFKEVSRDTMERFRIVLPPPSIANEFERILSAAFEKRRILEHENDELTKLRDWLLPMLMNGQATVADAEEEVSKVIPFAPQAVEVRQAARNFGDKKTDDTADLVKAFMRRKKNDSKA